MLTHLNAHQKQPDVLPVLHIMSNFRRPNNMKIENKTSKNVLLCLQCGILNYKTDTEEASTIALKKTAKNIYVLLLSGNPVQYVQ